VVAAAWWRRQAHEPLRGCTRVLTMAVLAILAMATLTMAMLTAAILTMAHRCEAVRACRRQGAARETPQARATARASPKQ
jgi:hypothetical protein